MTNNALESKRLLAVLKRKELPKLQTFDETCEYVTAFMVEHYKLEDESEINRGYCFIWAYLVWALSPVPIKLVTSSSHIVVKYQDAYYDATTFGEPSLEDIGCWGATKEVSVEQMSWFWARIGTYRRKFRTILRKTSKEIYTFVTLKGEEKLDKARDNWYDGNIELTDIPT